MESPTSTAVEAPPAGRRPKEHWVVLALGLAVLLGLAGLGLLIEPDARGFGTHEKLGMRPCLPMDQWGLPCPGCGVTTSVTLAAKGRFWESFANQPFGFLFAFLALGFGLWAPIAHLRGRDLWAHVRGLNVGRWFKTLGILIAIGWVWKLAVVYGWLAL